MASPADVLDLIPFARTLGIESIRSEPDEVVLRLAWGEHLCTAGGILHGGAIMSLADTAGAVSAFLNLPSGASGTTTIESKTNLLRAANGNHFDARATPLHLGRTLIVVETDVRDDQARLVARVTQTQLVLRV
jgi:1,4-dihydroxy-2-naphthoyl-CoA hydrolase